MGALEGKVAIVTGAANGIGRAIAQAYVRERARLVCADLDADRLAETVDALNPDAAPRSALSAVAGVGVAAQAEAVFLASDASSYMTGADLLVDGGYTAW